MKTRTRTIGISLALLFSLGMVAEPSSAFTSGSTGADGAFNPTSNTQLQLPPNGIFNFTSVNIPSGVTLTFKKNATNTPVVILVSGDFTLAGTIDIRGSNAPDGTSGGKPGTGGPGGYDGGRGGQMTPPVTGGNGLGPGGGTGGDHVNDAFGPAAGGGGGYAGFGSSANPGVISPAVGVGGPSYGSPFILPLIGGSGGGGGGGKKISSNVASPEFGSGGGGGGGAILIAASGTIRLDSSSAILAFGGLGGSVSAGFSGCGGGGSGGAIRIVATVVLANGLLNAYILGTTNCGAGVGSTGRIRIESESLTFTGSFVPVPSFDIPSPAFLASLPALTITSVAGVAAPAAPTGNTDVRLPTATVNPVSVGFATTGVPLGATINLTVTPSYGAAVTATSSPLTGTTANATATASVNLPTGHSVFVATVSYTIVASLGDAMSRFAKNERVEKIVLTATFGGSTKAKLITVSGKEYDAPAEALRIASLGG